jgi:hypothetical protein
MDHRGLSGNYYSFCKGKVVGDDTYHCKECKTCSGLDHWHSHRFSLLSFSFYPLSFSLSFKLHRWSGQVSLCSPVTPLPSPHFPPSVAHFFFLFFFVAILSQQKPHASQLTKSFCIPFLCLENYWLLTVKGKQRDREEIGERRIAKLAPISRAHFVKSNFS